jgi:hypothetical protein
VKLHKSILAALATKQAQNPVAPANLFDFKLADLTKIGYKRLKPTDEILDGDIIQMTEKAADLFCLVEGASWLRKQLKRTEIGMIPTYRK